ncbi:MAG: hypothetical protein Q4B32_01950 [Clostridia bacterium]|nr:hypothetical protein [Clostridia bacterium]
MKKFIALLMAAMMLLGCASALAEDAATTLIGTTGLPFNVEVPEVEGTTVSYEEYEGTVYVTFGQYDENGIVNGPTYFLTMSASDETLLDGANLSDATDEQIEELFQAIATEDGDYTYKVRDLDDGIRILYIVDNTLFDAAQVVTIKDGVFVNVQTWNVDFSPITDEMVENCIKLMDALKFVEKEAPATTDAPAA